MFLFEPLNDFILIRFGVRLVVKEPLNLNPLRIGELTSAFLGLGRIGGCCQSRGKCSSRF